MTKALQKCHSTQLSEIAAPVKAPRGCRRWPTAITRTARRRTATRRRARLRWQHSPRAGDGNRAAAAPLGGRTQAIAVAGRPEWLTKWQGSKRSVWLGRYRIMKPKLMWSRPPRITGLPEPDAKLVMGARRKGRPPLGSQATSGAERARRYRQRLAQLGKHASER